MFPTSSLCFVIGVLASVSSTNALTCGQTECNRDGYQKAYCCGRDGEICCRETVVNSWWLWLIVAVIILGIGIGIFLCCRYRRRQRIPYVVQTNASTIVTSQQAHVSQVPPLAIYPPYSGHPAQEGYVSKDPIPPGYGYPPAPCAPPQPN